LGFQCELPSLLILYRQKNSHQLMSETLF